MKEKNIHSKIQPDGQIDDPTASSRKKDHIEMSFRSQVVKDLKDERFYYRFGSLV